MSAACRVLWHWRARKERRLAGFPTLSQLNAEMVCWVTSGVLQRRQGNSPNGVIISFGMLLNYL